MWRKIPQFSFSAGERKIMAHFVVKHPFLVGILVPLRRDSGHALREIFRD